MRSFEEDLKWARLQLRLCAISAAIKTPSTFKPTGEWLR